MTRQTDTDWIVEGAKVALYIHGYDRDSVRIATVERLTKTQIVLPEDRRFRREDLVEIGQRGTWDPQAAELMRVDDPRVIDVRAGQRIRGLVAAVERATTGRIVTLATARTALAAIEAEIYTTRTALDRLASMRQTDGKEA